MSDIKIDKLEAEVIRLLDALAAPWRCDGCDGYECKYECQYPGARAKLKGEGDE